MPFASFDLRKPDSRTEPSVLIYQTNLCSALLSELEKRYQSSGRLSIEFEARVTSVDPVDGTVTCEGGNGEPACSA